MGARGDTCCATLLVAAAVCWRWASGAGLTKAVKYDQTVALSAVAGVLVAAALAACCCCCALAYARGGGTAVPQQPVDTRPDTVPLATAGRRSSQCTRDTDTGVGLVSQGRREGMLPPPPSYDEVTRDG